jgi:hypothetical protein
MKRGRPNKRVIIQSNLMEILTANTMPITTSSLRKMVSEKVGNDISWNTIQKYMDELVQVEKVQKIPTAHSKKEGKEGLVLYQIKR